jgi:alpha/beta superfamily hydrolase
MHARLRAAVALALVVPGLGLVAAQAATPKVASGSVVLRTTDDAGTCAGAPTAARQAGKACPTFRLYYATPAKPKALVVLFHGHGHNGDQYADQLRALAASQGVLAVAMQTTQLKTGLPAYRGPFDSVDEEARDAASAIAWARKTYGTGNRTYLFGTSMGGSGLAYFIDAATRAAAGDADATWVQRVRPLPLAGMVDAEGISQLAETWAEASAVDKVSAAEIETETGGTPVTAPDAYRARSLALLTPDQYKATGLPVVAVVHDVDDGLVPYNQTFEARAAFAAGGLTVRSYEVVFKESCSQGAQTTGTSYAPVPGAEEQLCLAGHANENDSSTPVMRAALKALTELLGGARESSAVVVNPTRP